MKRIHIRVLVLGLALGSVSLYAQTPPLPGQKPQPPSNQKKQEPKQTPPLPGQKQNSLDVAEAGGPSVEIVSRIPAEDRENLKGYWPQVESKTKDAWLHAMAGPLKSIASAQGDVRILGWIHTDGSATGLTVERSSGSKALDRAAIHAITEAAPFDAFPYGIAVDEVKVRFTFGTSGGPSETPKELPK